MRERGHICGTCTYQNFQNGCTCPNGTVQIELAYENVQHSLFGHSGTITMSFLKSTCPLWYIYVPRNLEIAHYSCTISRLCNTFALSRDYKRVMQSPDCLLNLRILRFRKLSDCMQHTYFATPVLCSHPPSHKLSSGVKVPLFPEKDSPIDLNIKAFVGRPGR